MPDFFSFSFFQRNGPFAPEHVSLFPQGCVGRVVGWVQAQSGLITGVGVGVGVLEVAGLVAAASLCRAIHSSTD